MSTDISCPACGAEFDLLIAFSNEADKQALKRFVSVSIPLGPRVLYYVALFTPPKRQLTTAKKLKLIMQLLPDLERQTITFKGRDWSVPLESWAMAFDQMQASREGGRLELPMKGHGYLYAILSGMADKREGQAEQQREADRRTVPQQATVQVRGETLSIGEALQVVHGGKNHVLAKLDEATRNAAPMPDAARALQAKLKEGKP